MINIKDVDINKVKNETVCLLQSIERDGKEDLITFLEKSNYFTIPANRIGYKWNDLEKPHPLNCKGGLAIHNWLVYKEFNRKNEMFNLLPHESVIVCSFLHSLWKLDACQLNKYGGFQPQNIENEHLLSKGQKSYEMTIPMMDINPKERNIITSYQGLFGVSDLNKNKGYSMEYFIDVLKRHPEIQVFSSIIREAFEYTRGDIDFVNDRPSKIENGEHFWL
ncbi:hypothetical protein Mpsy_2425 [Methanolobus psychrophilus R15]|nr:hypothetical protein Mpsy_2425 [Methanolobus psychrophilus R15]